MSLVLLASLCRVWRVCVRVCGSGQKNDGEMEQQREERKGNGMDGACNLIKQQHNRPCLLFFFFFFFFFFWFGLAVLSFLLLLLCFFFFPPVQVSAQSQE